MNLPSAGVEYQLPFGGTKDSSFGPKEQGPAALEFYSDYKTDLPEVLTIHATRTNQIERRGDRRGI